MTNQTGTSRATVIKVLRSGVISSLLSVILSLAVIPLILRETSLDTYGAWVTLGGLLAIARLTESGIPTEVARRVATAEGSGDRAAARQAVQQALTVMSLLCLALIVGGGITSVVVIPALFEGTTSPDIDTLQEVWLCTVLLLAISLVLATWFATLGGLQRHDFGAYGAVVGTVANAVTIVLLLAAGLGIWALFWGSVVQSLVAWSGPLRGMRKVRPDIALRPARISLTDLADLMGASTFLMVAAVAQISDRQIDKFILTRMQGSDSAGVFQIAVSLSAGPSMLAGLPAGLLLAGTAELVRSDPDKLDRLRRLMEKATYSGGFFVAGGVVVLVPSFVDLWLGEGFSEVASVTRILVVAAAVSVIAYPMYFYAMGRGWQVVIVTSALVSLGLNLAGSLALTPALGTQGAALGSLAGATGSTLTILYMLRRRDARTSIRHVWRPLVIVSLTTGAAILIMPDLSSWVTWVAGATTWSLVCLALLVAGKALPARIAFQRGRPRISLDS